MCLYDVSIIMRRDRHSIRTDHRELIIADVNELDRRVLYAGDRIDDHRCGDRPGV